MGTRKSSNEASENSNREKKWEIIFNALVKLSKNLQKDREFLEERIRSLNEVIHQMKMEQKFASSKAELMMGFEYREAFIYKHRYESAENAKSELADFREWIGEYMREQRDKSRDGIDKVEGEGAQLKIRALEDEVEKLKSEFEKYKSDKSVEISGLLADKDSIWKQYKEMEIDFSVRLRKKCEEVEQIVEKTEELQSSNKELRSESVPKDAEISRLLKEVEVLKSEKMNRTKPSAHKSTGGKAPKKKFIMKESSIRTRSKTKSRESVARNGIRKS